MRLFVRFLISRPRDRISLALFGVFVLDYFVGALYKVIYGAVWNIPVEIKLNPMLLHASVYRGAYRQIVLLDFLNFVGSGFDIDKSEVVNVDKAEHMVKNIEDQYGVIPSCKFAEWGFLCHIAQ